MVDGVRNGFGAPGRRGRPRSWVYTAGTVARIDLRLPHHPRSGSPLLRVLFDRKNENPHTHDTRVSRFERDRESCLDRGVSSLFGPFES